MTQVLLENALYSVELDENSFEEHVPHKSWGTYRVIDRSTARLLFKTPNRDKSFGVFEYLAQAAGLH